MSWITLLKSSSTDVDLALSYRRQSFNWKFKQLDRNNDNSLTKVFEFYHMKNELIFIISREISNSLFLLMDADRNGLLHKQEWLKFYDDLASLQLMKPD